MKTISEIIKKSIYDMDFILNLFNNPTELFKKYGIDIEDNINTITITDNSIMQGGYRP
jgi:hypothetical protein